MSKEDKRKRNTRHAEAMAKKYSGSQNSTDEIAASPSLAAPRSDGWKSLNPAYPDPSKKFEPLSPYLVDRITKATMTEMKCLAQKRHIPLDLKYWEQVTRAILGQKSTNTAIIVPAPAGSGKSTWILSFLLAIKEQFSSKPELENSLIGMTVVLQRVEDLNNLAETLNQGCTTDEPFMVPLQGWSTSGKRRGFCQNTGVDSYTECPRSRCPYATQCPIRTFSEKAPYVPVLGLTQERFYLLREDDLSLVLKRKGPDGNLHSRRYLLFDEKFRMAPVIALSIAQINEASTALNDAIQKYEVKDARVRGLQQRLNYAVLQPFQDIQKKQRTESGQDIPVGFLRLSVDEREKWSAYEEFKGAILTENGRFTSKPLSAVFSVMDSLYKDEDALFTKTNGFCIYRIDPPQIHFGDCQTIIFDATAEVDSDYQHLPNKEILSGMPKSKRRNVVIHAHTDSNLNVSKRAMNTPWKLPALADYVAELILDTDKLTFLCTYKSAAVELADILRTQLSPVDFGRILLMPNREMPTLPYFNGTNGSNIFKDAELVIILGYPRLDPSTYLAFACAAYGMGRIAKELSNIPEEDLLASSFNPLDLPSVREYVAHHLAARLEQEIYRCAQRNPGFTGEINIHLFCPPQDVLTILQERISCEIVYDDTLPVCVAQRKGMVRQYDGSSTSFGRLTQFLDRWDGSPIEVSALRDQLDISPAVWKDIMADSRLKPLLQKYGVVRNGRGPHAAWSIPDQKCA